MASNGRERRSRDCEWPGTGRNADDCARETNHLLDALTTPWR
jgi:hypothetical protein